MRTAPLLPLLLLALPAPAAREPQGPPPAAVRVEEVRAELLRQRRQVAGEARAARRSLVASEEPGRVEAVPVREGEEVETGAPLARLDSVRLELDLGALEARRRSAEAQRGERERDLEQAERDLATVRDLAERRAANAKELADAETAREIAAQRLQQSRHDLAELEARAELLRRRIEDMVVRAPFDGVVLARHAETGEWLREGDPVVELVSAAEVEAWLEVPQASYAALLARHGELLVRIDATGEQLSLGGYRVLPSVDRRARTFSVVAPLPETAGVAAGMSLTGWVQTAATGEHLVVSSSALGRNDAGPFVYAVVPAEEGAWSAAPVPVDVLWREGERAVLRPGALQPGARVVVEGNERLFPMAPVRIVEPGAGSAAGDGAR